MDPAVAARIDALWPSLGLDLGPDLTDTRPRRPEVA
jgi:hypothetical protein